MTMRRNALSILLIPVCLVSLALSSGCKGDTVDPEIQLIEVIAADGTTMTSIEPSDSGDTTIQDIDVPVDASFALTFNEPMDLLSLQDKIEVRDATSNPYNLNITQRLSVVNVAPDGEDFAPEQNHTIHIDSGILDTSGNASDVSYVINFYTAAN